MPTMLMNRYRDTLRTEFEAAAIKINEERRAASRSSAGSCDAARCRYQRGPRQPGRGEAVREHGRGVHSLESLRA
jgi:hypothetical protein